MALLTLPTVTQREFYVARVEDHANSVAYYAQKIRYPDPSEEFPMPEWDDAQLEVNAREAWHFARLLTPAEMDALADARLAATRADEFTL